MCKLNILFINESKRDVTREIRKYETNENKKNNIAKLQMQ